jgi:hypothetical protein
VLLWRRCFGGESAALSGVRRSLVNHVIEDQIQILLTGITSEPTIISGMPTRLNTIVEAQGLEMPFGCIDHRSVVKRLPTIPSKRKVALI